MNFVDKASNKEKVSDNWDDIRPMKVKFYAYPGTVKEYSTGVLFWFRVSLSR